MKAQRHMEPKGELFISGCRGRDSHHEWVQCSCWFWKIEAQREPHCTAQGLTKRQRRSSSCDDKTEGMRDLKQKPKFKLRLPDIQF